MIVMLVIIAILIAMGLVLYGRSTDEQAKALYSIGEALKGQEKQSIALQDAGPKKEGVDRKVSEPEVASVPDSETTQASPKADYNVGKSGKAYTKEELELQIRD